MKTKIISIFASFLFISCNTQENVEYYNKVIVDRAIYNKTKTSNYTIKDVLLADKLLKITMTSSGCDGKSWIASLIDSSIIAKSLPIQRYAKIKLKNEEACSAIVTREFTFNISDLKIDNEIILHLDGWKETIILK